MTLVVILPRLSVTSLRKKSVTVGEFVVDLTNVFDYLYTT
jgi:hypothetical protein